MNHQLKPDSHLFYSHMQTEKANPAQFESHCHNEYELLYVSRGNGKFVVEGAEYPLKSHTLMLIRPHEYHYVCLEKDSLYERYIMNFRRELFPPEVASLPILDIDLQKRHGLFFSEEHIISLIYDEFRTTEKIYQLLNTCENTQDAQRAILTAEITKVLLLLSLSTQSDEVHYEENIITHVTEHLDSHVTDELSLDKLAQRFFISKYYLCHAFRQQNGTSIHAYITSKRIVLAQQLLKDGESATSVARQVGFQNYSSFYRAYVKQLGRPPTVRTKKS